MPHNEAVHSYCYGVGVMLIAGLGIQARSHVDIHTILSLGASQPPNLSLIAGLSNDLDNTVSTLEELSVDFVKGCCRARTGTSPQALL